MNENFEKKIEEYEEMILRLKKDLNNEKLLNANLWKLEEEVLDIGKLSRKI